MSNFAVITHRLVIEPHPDADALECARIGGYFSVVRKGDFITGDVGAYIPEAAVLTPGLIEELQLGNHLAGPEHNRVHAVRLRGVLSQGVVYPMKDREPGEDVTEELGITKYVPEVPAHFDGAVKPAFGNLIRYEIDDIKMHPQMFEQGEEVVFTEKLHGTWCCLGLQDGEPLVTSKQLAARGMAFVTDEGQNEGNVYVEAYRRNREALERLGRRLNGQDFLLLGEVYGKGVQDLTYGTKGPEFRAFDVYVGDKEKGRFLDYHRLVESLDCLFDAVPRLYRGPFEQWVMLEHSKGRSTIGPHGREGIVIRPLIERGHPTLDRAVAKSLSEKHLLRKGGTEYN